MTRGRVVLFSNAPYFGGAEGYLVYLAQGLKPLGWDPIGLVPEGSCGAVLAGRFEKAGFPVEKFNHRHWTSPAGACDILKKLKQIDGEILHLNLPSPYEALRNTVAFWGRLAGYRRVVATEHLPMSLRARRRALLKILLAPAIDAFIIMTRSGAEDLHRIHGIGQDKIVRIPYGIDPAPEVAPAGRRDLLEGLKLPPETRLVGHVGRLTARKGHRILLEALAQEKEMLRDRRTAVLFIGEGEEEENLRRCSETLVLNEFVHFMGHRENARNLIGLLDLLVLPSFVETQPFVILEAMAAGIPVLSTMVYGIPDMVVHEVTGLLVEPGAIGPLGAALKRLLLEDETRIKMGRSGLERFNELFRMDRMAEKTERVYAAQNGVGL
ncbi:MAG: glycosyltransferase family 4 protein [Candidatus Eisenbacteria bacterium]|uniref:Glycosyltransferase family 4 protein n=1 Tax=Eiseniibacteriota bacterium TaxID=2212470 RepID=A0A948W332_UNCEI|nr:glycosyltransferase family 4 protein [Candidatus Eisenbacteria bacterium]MBU1950544.1 glycosyltransferase family 4 protein [Candidatus Eisenbacteria bacterium]MBU2690637.1 glycosyltransferase family 4 protein [Candidatus Eisenbacteria bacterium]